MAGQELGLVGDESFERLAEVVDSGRVRPIDPNVMAAQLWALVHGFATLELAGHFAAFDDPVSDVLLPLGVSYYVGLGDTPERAARSHVAAAD